MADPLIFDPVFTLLSTLTADTVYSLPATLEGATRTCSNGACQSIYRDGEALLHSLSRKIQEKARVPGTRDCQKVCIATCVTSRLLTYEKTLLYEASPEAASAIIGRGACTEYSRIADRFIGDLGFESYTVGNIRLQHQYNWVRIDSGS